MKPPKLPQLQLILSASPGKPKAGQVPQILQDYNAEKARLASLSPFKREHAKALARAKAPGLSSLLGRLNNNGVIRSAISQVLKPVA